MGIFSKDKKSSRGSKRRGADDDRGRMLEDRNSSSSMRRKSSKDESSSKKKPRYNPEKVDIPPSGKFGLQAAELKMLVQNQDLDALKKYQGPDGIARALRSDTGKGLRSDLKDLDARTQQFGENKLPQEKPKGLLQLMWDGLKDPTLIMLLICAGLETPISMAFESASTGWIEGTAIVCTVIVVLLVGALTDYQKEQQFRELNEVKSDYSFEAIRDGAQTTLSVSDVLVGDLLLLAVGDIIPADGIFIQGFDLRIEEAAITGESVAVLKDESKRPFIFGGTNVMQGSGRFLVTAVGVNTMTGTISQTIKNKEPEPTPLQSKLEKLATDISKFGLAAAILTVLAMAIRFAIETEEWESSMWSDLLHMLLTGVTVLVVAVPEGLPLAVVLSMAFSVKKMLAERNLVRHLEACETMGGATTICSDKTGTLTLNRMTVVKSWFYDHISDSKPDLPKAMVKILCHGIALNSDARLEKKDSGPPDQIGNKTECALLGLAENLGANYEDIRNDNHIVHRNNFSSKTKSMSSIVEKGKGKYRVFVKGASEIVLDRCTTALDEDGKSVTLSQKDKNNIVKDVIEHFATKALRTICLAYRDVEGEMDWTDTKKLEKDLVCVGIVGIEDPVRKEVPGAVKQCQAAGIRVRMVTGDNLITAKSIAEQCGIFDPKERDAIAMEGPTFRKRVLVYDKETEKHSLDMEEFDRIWPNLRVLARSSPTDKYWLVQGLMKSTKFKDQQVVAVTGDGTNDAPALAEANVGFAMNSGTEVAKEASDIILMDDNFNSIVTAVKWGRNVYDSIGKFVQFQLTVNVSAIVVAFVGAVSIRVSPLTAVQMLWVNLIMDSLASLALATEPPTDDLLNRPPYGKSTPLISRTMMKKILGQATYQIGVLMYILFKPEAFNVEKGYTGGHTSHEPSEHFAIFFNTFVLMQLFNELNARTLHNELNIFKGMTRNNYFVVIMVVTFSLQILIVEQGGRAFWCHPLTLNHWLACLLFGVGTLFMGVLLSLIPDSIFPQLTSRDDNDEESNRSLSRRSSSFGLRGTAKLRASTAAISLISRHNSRRFSDGPPREESASMTY